MELSVRVAVLTSVLGLAACTTLLGVDGDYDAGPDGAGGATSTSTTDVATQATSTVASSSVGGGSTTSSASGGGDDCPVCVIEPRSSEAAGSRPRFSTPSPSLLYTFLRGDTVQERTALATQPEHAAPGVIDAVIANGAGDGQLLWAANPTEEGIAELHGATPGTVAVWGDHFEATLTDTGTYVATHDADGLPVLLFCDEVGCTPNFECADSLLHGPRDVALARSGEAIAYARSCAGSLVVSMAKPSTAEVLRIENLPFDEVAVALGPGAVPVVATVTAAGTDQARVQVLTRDEVAAAVDLAFARSPTMVAIEDGTLVVVQVSEGTEDTTTLAAVFCGPLLSDGCAHVDLTGIDLAGATHPSLGLVGDADVWLAFAQNGNVVVGQLGP